jgi:hypothetical protein
MMLRLLALSTAVAAGCGGDDDPGPTVNLAIEATDILSDEVIDAMEVCQVRPRMGQCATTGVDGLVSLVVPDQSDVAVRFTKEPDYFPGLALVSTRGVDEEIEADMPQNFAVTVTAAGAGMDVEAGRGMLLFLPDVAGPSVDLSGMTVAIDPPDRDVLYFGEDMVPDAALTTTSAIGLAAFANIAPGEYTVTFTHPTIGCSGIESGWLADDPRSVRALVEADTFTEIQLTGCE